MTHKMRLCPTCGRQAYGRSFKRYVEYRCLCGWVCEELRDTDECLQSAIRPAPSQLWSYYLVFAREVQCHDLHLHTSEQQRLAYFRRCVEIGLFTEEDHRAVNVS